MRVRRRRWGAASAAIAVSGAMLCGCGPIATGGLPGGAPGSGIGSRSSLLSKALSFEYVGETDVDETINQTLEITNASPGRSSRSCP